MMTTAKSATGVEGCLIRGIDGEYYFRVYDADHNFQDYDLMHSDLSITVTDPDAFFYNDEFTARLDHAPATLGLE
jgi:hypothetical protein